MVDLTKGINIQIKGELGRFNTLPVDAFVKIAAAFQELIFTIAKTDVRESESIDFNNFKIEISGFHTGSAIPEFKFTPRTQTVIGGNVINQRRQINRKFDALMKIANSGEYQRLKNTYQRPSERNDIVNNLYDFIHSFKNAPVSILDEDLKPVYSIKRFRPEVKTALLSKIIPAQIEEPTATYGVAKVKIVKMGDTLSRRIQGEVYAKNENTISYSPELIIHHNRAYYLNYPLRSLLEKEDDFYFIKNELLDIIGTGPTEDAAEKSFAEEFDYIFMRYNELNDDQLTERIKIIKQILKYIIRSVEQD